MLQQNLNWKFHLKAIAILIVLQYLIDLAFVYIYPTVSPLRALFIGVTAFALLSIPWLEQQLKLPAKWSFFPIVLNALLGALSVQGGLVASRSVESGLLHAAILIITYAGIVAFRSKK